MEKIKKINQEFKTNGYTYQLIERIENIVLYKGIDKDLVIVWEVHKIRIQKIPEQWKKNQLYKGFDEWERLAGNEDFGKYGWSYQTEELARKKMMETVNL